MKITRSTLGRLTAEDRLRLLIREELARTAVNEAPEAPLTWGRLMSLFSAPRERGVSLADVAVDDAGPGLRTSGGGTATGAGDSRLDAAVVGDSQAGGALGAAVRSRLEGMGYTVTVTYENGAPGAKIAAEQIPPAGSMPDLVVACFGGNDGSAGAVRAAARLIYDKVVGSGGFLVAVGPPPATRITDPALAGRVFPALGPTPDPGAWFELERGAYVDRRVEKAEAIESALEGLAGAAAYGIAAQAGSSYPDQPDGLHLVVGAGGVVDSIFSKIDIAKITAQLKSAIAARAQEQEQEQEYTLSATAEEIASAYPKMRSYADMIISVSDTIGIKPNWLANVINFESIGGDPRARNKLSNATGLIQFMPATARGLGTSIDALYNMTAREQMFWVDAYFKPYRGRLNSQEDVYMAVFYPVAIGKPDAWTFPPKVEKWNPGISTPADYAQKANRNARLPV